MCFVWIAADCCIVPTNIWNLKLHFAYQHLEPLKMPSIYIYVLLAVLGGIAVASQAPINARLREIVVSPVMSALISFAIGTLALFLMHLTNFAGPASFEKLTKMPWWYWTGGVLGAFFVFALLTSVPQLGAASVVSFVIVGQLLGAMLIDSFGLLGQPVIQVTWMRVAGALFLVLGAFLIKQGTLPIK